LAGEAREDEAVPLPLAGEAREWEAVTSLGRGGKGLWRRAGRGSGPYGGGIGAGDNYPDLSVSCEGS